MSRKRSSGKRLCPRFEALVIARAIWARIPAFSGIITALVTPVAAKPARMRRTTLARSAACMLPACAMMRRMSRADTGLAMMPMTGPVILHSLCFILPRHSACQSADSGAVVGKQLISGSYPRRDGIAEGGVVQRLSHHAVVAEPGEAGPRPGFSDSVLAVPRVDGSLRQVDQYFTPRLPRFQESFARSRDTDG